MEEDEIPIAVRLHVECAKCGHSEDDTHEFSISIGEKASPSKGREPGKCPACGAPIWIYLSRERVLH
jgi:Zn ribbon nucleic-acid-binding protein